MYKSKFNYLLGSLSVLVGNVLSQSDYDRISKNAREYTGSPTRGIIKEIDIDFGEIGERTIEVEFTYHPAERQTHDEPGCDAEYDIIAITYEGEDIGFLIDNDAMIIEKLEEMRDCGEDY